jgi:hypothetical protein
MFKCLGSIIESSLISDADVDKRIKAAASAFSVLKNFLANLSVDLRVIGRLYSALVLGGEAWYGENTSPAERRLPQWLLTLDVPHHNSLHD